MRTVAPLGRDGYGRFADVAGTGGILLSSGSSPARPYPSEVPMRALAATSLLAASLALAAPAAADGRCVRTPSSPYHEVCVDEHGCTVYWWSTMPPAVCL